MNTCVRSISIEFATQVIEKLYYFISYFTLFTPHIFALVDLPLFTVICCSSSFSCCVCLCQAEGETEVLVPGDPERKHMAMCNQEGGIPYHPNVINNLVSYSSQKVLRYHWKERCRICLIQSIFNV